MRKVMSVLGSAALMVGFLGLAATPAFADPNSSQLCSENADFGFSHGACVSLLQSDGNSSAVFVSICKQLQEQSPTEFDAVFKNRGDCVSLLNTVK